MREWTKAAIRSKGAHDHQPDDHLPVDRERSTRLFDAIVAAADVGAIEGFLGRRASGDAKGLEKPISAPGQ